MSKYGFLNSYAKSDVGISLGRSKFNLPFEHLTTFSSGYWFPVHCVEVLPGDTFDVELSQLVRMMTPVVPTMDNAILELAAFFVPMRLALAGEHDWEQICVGSEPSAWTNGFDKTIITTGNVLHFNDSSDNTPDGSTITIDSQSLAAYLGLPVGEHSINTISAAPFNAVMRVWNEWLRDENLTESFDWRNYSGGMSSNAYVTDLSITPNGILRAYKLHDYFTSALPAPQKGGAVYVPIGDSAPVIGGFTTVATGSAGGPLYGVPVVGTTPTQVDVKMGGLDGTILDNNLSVDLSQAVGASVNAIRMSFALQRLQEKLARGGSRYNEFLRAVFGVYANPGMLNMSEYINGCSIPINVTQVLQTSSTDTTSPLGSTGAFSNTYGNSSRFKKSFVEYGYFLVMATVRPVQSYSQGVPLMFRRYSPLDIYSPTFALIGEQPIYTEELYYNSDTARYAESDGSVVSDPLVFGYKEPWIEYQRPYKRISGHFVPASDDKTLAPWTYTTNFTGTPTLSSSFMVQPKSQIAQTLVDTTTSTQFYGDFVCNIVAYRHMLVNPAPGLIDHL